MRVPRPRLPVRDYEIGPLLDVLLISAVATILVIRLQLWLTDYPQLGGGKLHIAHLLYGGFFMLAAIVIMLSFLTRTSQHAAALLGGIGFGFFIDELGKFITEDNDYFFQPTAAIIYLVFVVLFLSTRGLQRRRGFTQREYLMNTIELLEDAALHDLDERERRRALSFLDRADQSDPLVAPVRTLLEHIETIPAKQPSRPRRGAQTLEEAYLRLIEKRWFTRAMSIFFICYAAVSLVRILGLVLALGALAFGRDAFAVFQAFFNHVDDFSFITWATIASSAASAVLWVIGAVKLRTQGRAAAYQMFERGLLVSIFITQVFVFIRSSFSAVFGLGFNVALLVTLRFMMREEERIKRGESKPGVRAKAAVRARV